MIKSIRGRSLNTWLKWLDKELTVPYASGVAQHEDVRKVLHAFRELILKVQYQKEKEVVQELENYLKEVF